MMLSHVTITGFHNHKETQIFENNTRSLAKKKEFTECATLYPGRCPPLILKRVLAIRCLLCEHEYFWRATKGKNVVTYYIRKVSWIGIKDN